MRKPNRTAPTVGVISGYVGDVSFDDANTTQCSRCLASSDTSKTVLVEIEVYPDPDDSSVLLTFRGYDSTKERQDLQVGAAELEPLAVALSRAVENAKARGFLPTTSPDLANAKA